MNAYHKDLGFPSSLVIPKDVFLELNYTRHALEQKVRERYKVHILPNVIKVTDRNVIEAHSRDNINPEKLMIRSHFDQNYDIVLVVKPYFRTFTAKVITFWLGHKKERQVPIKEKYTPLNQPV